MQVQFQKQDVPCLQNLLTRIQTLEQTQEMTVGEDRDGAGILGTWGQVLLRSKERQGDRLLMTGGVMVWVLLAGEAGGPPECLDSWIPFRLDWDLPDEAGDGTDRILPVLANLDARFTGAGKILIRAGVSALAECWQRTAVSVPRSAEVPEDVALQVGHWPVWLSREAGEKPFSLDETLTLPASLPAVERILYYRMDPGITDQKVLGSRLVFRGSGNLHICYLCPEGKVRSYDAQLSFSQYTELSGRYSPDARGSVLPAVTRLELEREEEGKLVLRAGFTAQYLVEDRQLLETVTDAFSPRREVDVQLQKLSLPVILDSCRETVSAEETMPGGEMSDVTVLADLPRLLRQGDRVRVEVPQRAAALYYDDDGILRGESCRWNASGELAADPEGILTALPGPVQIRLLPGLEGMAVCTELNVTLRTMDGSGLPAVTGLTLGELRDPDPDRPSLILRRAGTDSLWELARRSGSTVDAIMAANGLAGEPEPERMLLIPVV